MGKQRNGYQRSWEGCTDTKCADLHFTGFVDQVNSTSNAADSSAASTSGVGSGGDSFMGGLIVCYMYRRLPPPLFPTLSITLTLSLTLSLTLKPCQVSRPATPLRLTCPAC